MNYIPLLMETLSLSAICSFNFEFKGNEYRVEREKIVAIIFQSADPDWNLFAHLLL